MNNTQGKELSNLDMENLKKLVRRSIKKMASIKMAVVSISMIAVVTAIGTIVESQFDALAAQKLVYQSLWMELVLGVFAINLISVIVDRYPWKMRHLAFICAHVGILMILLGQYISNNYGIDGSLRVGVGETNRMLILPGKTDLIVYSSFDGSSYSKLQEKEVDFFLNPPSKNKPLVVSTDKSEIRLTDYQKYVVPSRKVVESQQIRVGAGLRFQIHNDRVNVVEWLVQKNANHLISHDFGPAQIHLGPIPAEGRGANEIFLEPPNEPPTELPAGPAKDLPVTSAPNSNRASSGKIKYAVFKKDQKTATLRGEVEEGGVVIPGWMGLELKVLRFFPRAEEIWDLKPKDRPTPLTTGAVKVEFEGKEHWLLLNDTLKLFTEHAVYIMTYANRRIELGFPVKLEKFMMDRYQGTMRAASYRSQVHLPEVGSVEISMNEPLKHQGFTIYQSSFEDGPQGAPVASVFSVNRDPGRALKYFGSFVMTVGILLLFYFKKRAQASLKKGQTP